jgi:DNA-binding PadR family transcriptional regulator
MADLTAFQWDMLYVIAGMDNPHGQAIKDELEEYYRREIYHSQLYSNLDMLTERGLVEKGKRNARTNYYALTRCGRRVLEARHEWKKWYVP